MELEVRERLEGAGGEEERRWGINRQWRWKVEVGRYVLRDLGLWAHEGGQCICHAY